jgi:hypothetical protein
LGAVARSSLNRAPVALSSDWEVRMSVDTSQANRLAVDLSQAPGRLQRRAPKTMKRSALEIKKRMQSDFSGHRFAGGVPFSLEFERRDALGLSYEIGELDSAGRQWGIAAILAFGTANNAPVVDHAAGLRREAPTMLNHLADDAEGSVFGER